ncbi:unnamed protein product [Laminaria digitata]
MSRVYVPWIFSRASFCLQVIQDGIPQPVLPAYAYCGARIILCLLSSIETPFCCCLFCDYGPDFREIWERENVTLGGSGVGSWVSGVGWVGMVGYVCVKVGLEWSEHVFVNRLYGIFTRPPHHSCLITCLQLHAHTFYGAIFFSLGSQSSVIFAVAISLRRSQKGEKFFEFSGTFCPVFLLFFPLILSPAYSEIADFVFCFSPL